MSILKLGSKGDEVKKLQEKLGLTADGAFGPKTDAAVKEFQKKNNLEVDGIVGPKTWNELNKIIDKPVSSGENKEKYPKMQNPKQYVHIIINYGHSEKTPGKCSPLYSTLSKTDQRYFQQYPQFGKDRYYEWMSNRVIGKQITASLKERGWMVDEIMQVSGNGLTEINTATKKYVKEYGSSNCIFISIHSNAAPAKDNGWANAKGWCIYTTKGQDRSDKLADCIYTYADEYFVKEDGRNIRKNTTDGDPDQESNFSVIWNAKQLGIPGVLTENFFFNDIDDLKYLVSEKGQNSIVRTHVMGIEDYIYKYMIRTMK